MKDTERRREFRPYPDDEITTAVIESLTLFADASRGRYANLATIAGQLSPHDPVAKTNWWTTVVERVLARHYRGTKREARDREQADRVEQDLGSSSMVLHNDECGNLIDDLRAALMRGYESKIARRYGRFYVLCLVRWMSDIFGTLTHNGSYDERIAILFGHDGRVATFRVPDDFLLNRKRWPLI